MYDRLVKIIKENLPNKSLEGINENSRLKEDLGMDSVGMMMLAMSIEDEFGVEFNEPVAFITVKDVIAYLEAHNAK